MGGRGLSVAAPYDVHGDLPAHEAAGAALRAVGGPEAVHFASPAAGPPPATPAAELHG